MNKVKIMPEKGAYFLIKCDGIEDNGIIKDNNARLFTLQGVHEEVYNDEYENCKVQIDDNTAMQGKVRINKLQDGNVDILIG